MMDDRWRSCLILLIFTEPYHISYYHINPKLLFVCSFVTLSSRTHVHHTGCNGQNPLVFSLKRYFCLSLAANKKNALIYFLLLLFYYSSQQHVVYDHTLHAYMRCAI